MVDQVSDAIQITVWPSLLRRAEWCGLALIVLCVTGIAWSGWYDGKMSPDPSTDTELRVLTAQMGDLTSLEAEPDRAKIRAGKILPVTKRWLWTGTLRTFTVYRSTQAAISDELVDAAIATGFSNLTNWERRRGQLLMSSEQPAQIGRMLFVESAPRRFTWLGWTHVLHRYDPMRLLLAAILGGLALFAYIVIRLVILVLVVTYKYITTGAVPPWARFFDEEPAESRLTGFR